MPLQPMEDKNVNPRSEEDKQNENPQAVNEAISKARYSKLFDFFIL